jgi:hypothetical protein
VPFCFYGFADWGDDGPLRERRRVPGVGQGKGRGITKPALGGPRPPPPPAAPPPPPPPPSQARRTPTSAQVAR